MKIHFIAIGGAIMHQLAIALTLKGYEITGSDDVIYNPSLTSLKKHSLLPSTFGWFPSKINKDVDAIILGMHAKPDNPELLKAIELGIPIHSFPSYLYQISKDKKRIVIAGSHGKTTITSILAHALNGFNTQFDLAVGASIPGFERQVLIEDQNDIIIIEGDEYLSSPIDREPKFIHYKPHIAVLNGIAWDHINVFTTFDDYVNQFKKLIEGIEPNGVLCYNTEDQEVVKLINNITRTDLTLIPYGLPDYSIKQRNFTVNFEGDNYSTNLIGKHNLNNLEAARSVINELGYSTAEFYNSIKEYSGASKRLEILVSHEDQVVIKDFAHAPSKVTASVKAAIETYKNLPVYAFAELHTYSSMNTKFMPLYDGAFNGCAEAVVFIDEHALKIKNMAMPSAEAIKQAFGTENLRVFTDATKLKEFTLQLSQEKGVFLMMSSGSWGKTNLPELLAAKLNR